MNNHFSLHRLRLLIAKQWGENAKLYLLGMIAITGLLAFVFFLWGAMHGTNTHFREEDFYFFGLIGLYISGSVFAGMQFSSLSQKDKAMQWLGTPARHGEKLTAGIFFSLIVFNAFYVVSFLLVKSVGLYLLQLNSNVTLARIDWKSENVRILSRYFVIGYIAVQAVFLMGSVYFNRYAFVKTMIAGLLLFVAFIFFVDSFLRPAFLHGGQLWNFTSFRVSDVAGTERLYSLPRWVEKMVEVIAWYAWAPVCWAITLFRLKEKEV